MVARFLLPACPALIFCTTFHLAGVRTASGQVSPAEILNPRLRSSEETYLRQLQAYNRAIQLIRFPFPFYLTRYVQREPQKQVETDTRGLEFVKFHDRVVLKITGVYGASFEGGRLTQNERASRVFQEVIVPILQILPEQIPGDVTCDAVGFEISYHARTRSRNFDYEGKEILVVALDKADAFDYFKPPRESQRQDILNRSEIYLNGKELGLALGEREAISVEALDRSAKHQPARTSEPAPESAPSNSDARLSRINRDLPPGFHIPERQPADAAGSASTAAGLSPGSAQPARPATQAGTATQADADRLQAKYQSQLDGLAKEGATQFHLVDYAPPSFVVFRGKVFLQVTLRNALDFERETTSIYKRAAQSFDLFLAPQLKSLLDKIPADAEIEGLDITLLNQLASKPKPSSEALEFIGPLTPLRQFVEAEITNQDLINQSTVLVNGVRIALDLQRVE